MPAFFPLAATETLGDTVLLNRAVYGGNLELPNLFLDDYDPARDPSNAGIRASLNVYDRYDTYLAQFGFQTLGATELGFTPAEMSFVDDNQPGDGAGVDQNWFYGGDLYRNHFVQQDDGSSTVFDNAAAVAIAAVKEENGTKTLHLVFRGTDADLGNDGEAGTGPGQVRYYGQLKPLIDKARAFAEDTANGITDVVISGHSLGGSMVDMFALYDGAAFDAIPDVDLTVVALASAGIDPVTLQLKPDFDTNLVTIGIDGATFNTPDWYTQYDNANDIVRNPENYDTAAHTQNDPQQAPQTRAAISTLEEHLEFTEHRLTVESPFLDQYAEAATLETLFLPEHYSSYYELIGLGIEAAAPFAADLSFDRIIALGGKNPNITETSGTNNANGFSVPVNNTIDLSAETGTLLVMGLSGNDTITGGLADDLLDGGTGNDILLGGAGADILVGAGGRDRAQYDDAPAGLRADLQFAVVNTGIAEGDTYFSIEDLRGSRFDDDLRGDTENNSLYGRGGADILAGRDGNDVLFGGGGDDLIRGGNGNDTLVGGTGADFLSGGDGRDRALYGDAATGVTVDLAFSTQNTGIAAGDTFASIEVVQGSDHDDILRGDTAANSIFGAAGDDEIVGRGGDDTLYGRGGDDNLSGGGNDDTLRGGSGADVLNGGAGRDRAVYDDSASGLTVDLQAASLNTGIASGDTFVSIEVLTGSAHDDVLRGSFRPDVILGSRGNDTIIGRGGDDSLRGGDGADRLDGGAGRDLLVGGNGGDNSYRAHPQQMPTITSSTMRAPASCSMMKMALAARQKFKSRHCSTMPHLMRKTFSSCSCAIVPGAAHGSARHPIDLAPGAAHGFARHPIDLAPGASHGFARSAL